MSRVSALVISNTRTFSTTSLQHGKRNFRKFLMYGKRGTKQLKKEMMTKPDPELAQVFDRGVRPIGEFAGKKFQIIPEMIPEIIVPNLEGFQLKPYVSYNVPDVIQGEFGPQDLFYAVYSEKIAEDFNNNKLNEDGSPVEPSKEELLTSEEAKNRALSMCSDIL
ncbi:large ribosomal subunit protein mL41 [Cherax quadricarinatus]